MNFNYPSKEFNFVKIKDKNHLKKLLRNEATENNIRKIFYKLIQDANILKYVKKDRIDYMRTAANAQVNYTL